MSAVRLGLLCGLLALVSAPGLGCGSFSTRDTLLGSHTSLSDADAGDHEDGGEEDRDGGDDGDGGEPDGSAPDGGAPADDDGGFWDDDGGLDFDGGSFPDAGP